MQDWSNVRTTIYEYKLYIHVHMGAIEFTRTLRFVHLLLLLLLLLLYQ